MITQNSSASKSTILYPIAAAVLGLIGLVFYGSVRSAQYPDIPVLTFDLSIPAMNPLITGIIPSILFGINRCFAVAPHMRTTKPLLRHSPLILLGWGGEFLQLVTLPEHTAPRFLVNYCNNGVLIGLIL